MICIEREIKRRAYACLSIPTVLLVAWFLASGCATVIPSSYSTATLYPTYTPYPTFTPLPQVTPHLVSLDSYGSEPIPWQDAEAFTGQQVTVQGKVVATYNSGKVVFLNFSPNYQHTFKVVIFPEDWGEFQAPPEDLFHGQSVLVTGLIEEYQGAPEIIVRQSNQIQIIADTGCPVCPPCPSDSPTTVTTPSDTLAVTSIPRATTPTFALTPVFVPPNIIAFEEAINHIGQEMTVEGEVVDTYRSDKVARLNFHHDWTHHFNVVLFPESWSLFPELPDEMFQGQRVRVSGLIQEYRGAPQIIVRSSEQIMIVEGE